MGQVVIMVFLWTVLMTAFVEVLEQGRHLFFTFVMEILTS
ncbi:hypothetical protein SAMN04487970_102771 [Paenibacillus tianmuensis]|uniref:Uncharacterized protein n=1 Tax=Paenibacillus tianmuensis TaxID=624147 RepID=A0A1G4SF54_9BACL|nr:hypothetical protein SAMN04487970_102771 [Paenibacillus tianmuensis]